MFYNFVCIHQTLKVTPAMAAGVTNRLWDIHDVVALLEAYRAEQAEAAKVEAREKRERSYNTFGGALGGGAVKF